MPVLRPALAGCLLLVSSCSSGSDVAAAVVGAGAAVAVAGVNRAVTGECWASCPPGKQCDEDSGTCVDLPCRGECPPETYCARVHGEERCIQHLEDHGPGAPSATGAPGAPGAPGAGGEEVDPCRGLCLPGERCEMKGGVADCVAEPAKKGR